MANAAPFTKPRPLLDPIYTNPVDIMQGELENRCSLSDLQEPLNSFPLPDFPFLSIQIHLQWELEDVINDQFSPHDLKGSSFGANRNVSEMRMEEEVGRNFLCFFPTR